MAGESYAAQTANMRELARAEANLAAVLSGEIEACAEAVDTVGQTLGNEIKDLISTQGPPPSEPGEPPHKDTGDLYDSIEYTVGRDGATFFTQVGSDEEYAEYLEFGTSRMEARPFFRPAIENVTPRLQDLVVDALASAGEKRAMGASAAEAAFTGLFVTFATGE